MLTGKQKRFLRALATAHDPVVQVGKNGVTDSVLFSLNEALTAREIVKIKVLKNCLEETKSVGLVLSEKTESELVQVVGRNIVLYKPNKEKPEIILPE
jgi:RNA-binding protein